MKLSQLDCDRDNELIATYIRRWRRYSLSFYIEALQGDKYWYPTLQQYELCQLSDRNRHIAIKAGRGVAKTNFLAFRVLHHLVCFRIPGLPLKVPITGPTGGQLTEVIWAEIPAMMEHLLPWLRERFVINNDVLYCHELPKNWFAAPRTAKKENVTALTGHHGSTLNIYDEMSGIETPLIKASVAGMTQSYARSLAAGNPDRLSGYFYNIWNENYRRWTKYSINCFDCRTDKVYEYPYVDPFGETQIIKKEGIIDPQWFEDQKDELGEGTPAWDAYVLGEFPESEEWALIKKEWLKEVFTTTAYNDTNHPRILGLDPGGEKTPSGLVVRRGRDVEHAERIYQNESPALAAAVIDVFERWKAQGRPIKHIGVDDIGIGHGAKGILVARGYPAVSVKASEKGPEYGMACNKMRDWMWWQAKCYYQDNKIHYARDDEEFRQLKKELPLPRQKPFRLGKFNCEDKEDLAKRSLKSPNLADAHNLTFKLDYALQSYQKRTKKRGAYDIVEVTEGENWKTL